MCVSRETSLHSVQRTDILALITKVITVLNLMTEHTNISSPILQTETSLGGHSTEFKKTVWVTEHMNTNSPILQTETSLGGHSTELKRQFGTGKRVPASRVDRDTSANIVCFLQA